MRKVSDLPSMQFYRAKQAKPVFTSPRPVQYVVKRDWRIELAWAVAGTLGSFIVVLLILS